MLKGGGDSDKSYQHDHSASDTPPARALMLLTSGSWGHHLCLRRHLARDPLCQSAQADSSLHGTRPVIHPPSPSLADCHLRLALFAAGFIFFFSVNQCSLSTARWALSSLYSRIATFALQRTFRFTPLGLAFCFFRFGNTHLLREERRTSFSSSLIWLYITVREL